MTCHQRSEENDQTGWSLFRKTTVTQITTKAVLKAKWVQPGTSKLPLKKLPVSVYTFFFFSLNHCGVIHHN